MVLRKEKHFSSRTILDPNDDDNDDKWSSYLLAWKLIILLKITKSALNAQTHQNNTKGEKNARKTIQLEKQNKKSFFSS